MMPLHLLVFILHAGIYGFYPKCLTLLTDISFCRQEGVPRTFKEICAVSKISKKEIGRCFKLILKALETSVDIITTADFMSRFCTNLGKWNYFAISERFDEHSC